MPSTAADREKPKVPNHEMVRIIGRGSYGEIWLARSLTGTLRAVKIVDRRTFESDRAFEREFEGMAKFEPISRSDAGFVDILHVGRDVAGGFFYYVMELADDHLGGGRIDPEHYVPKTLKSELARRSRLLADECVTIGISLSKALAALHAQGLVHRDIKPANIIFVGGVPKIADIGLVAASGQDSYVGTEGYVPPEGPGAVPADIFSLGKVLYEIAMGKDRMDFPAVSTRLAELPDKELLMALNEVLLRACANDVAERYATAEEMCEDLERIRDGRPLTRRGRSRWPLVAALVAVLTLGCGWYVATQRLARGGVSIETDPPGVKVVLAGTMKDTPAAFDQLRLGTHPMRIMKTGYVPKDVTVEVTQESRARPLKFTLERARGAVEIRSEPDGAAFVLKSGDGVPRTGTTPATLSDLPTGEYDLRVTLDGRVQDEKVEIERGETVQKKVEFASGKIVVKSQPAGAQIMVDGRPAGVAPLELALAEGAHEFTAKYRAWPEQQRTASAARATPGEVAFIFPYGSVKITSAPGGAIVVANGKERGMTPLLLENVEPGDVRYELRLAGFKNIEVSGAVKPGEQTFLAERFVKRAGPAHGEVFENSLGMKFVPVRDVLMCVWPARVQDFEAFCAASGRGRSVADFAQDATHPVVKVNWDDANAFCEWLTKREAEAGQLEDGQHYRLPSDAEWSMAAGLTEDARGTPEERDGKLPGYPWGDQWPPPAGAGNFADGAQKRPAAISGYHDGFAQTSPVGNFTPNRLGLFDMAGNVWQWCLDPYKPGSRWGVLRGGSWANAVPAELRSSYRNVVDRAERDVIFGFRAVLVPDQK